MDRLYRAGLNCGVQSFWDGGWRAYIADAADHIVTERVFAAEEVRQVADWLALEGRRHFGSALERGAPLMPQSQEYR